MINRKSKRLPIVGRDHSFKITIIDDAAHVLVLAEKHYNITKRKQCIADYNIAVKDLDVVYDKMMQVDETVEKMQTSLKELQNEKSGLEVLVDDTRNRLILTKAKLQNLGVSVNALAKLGQQVKSTGVGTHSTAVPAIRAPEDNQIPVLSIPDDEQDQAIKNLIASNKLAEPIDLTSDSDVPKTSNAATHNVVTTGITTQTVATTGQNVVIADKTTPNVVIADKTTQNVVIQDLTPQNIVIPTGDIVQSALDATDLQLQESSSALIKVVKLPNGQEVYQLVPTQQQPPKINPVLVQAQNLLQQSGVNIQRTTPQAAPQATPQVVTEHVQQTTPTKQSIPEGYKKTKYENTLEKINPVPEGDKQKAGKRFFCALCMNNEIETGYTKRFDLTKHLVRCGKESTDKPFKCTGYENCDKSFARIENLRQHVAGNHTKELLYTCKKCGKGFSRSTDASNHRRICYQDPTEEEEEEEKTEEKEQTEDV